MKRPTIGVEGNVQDAFNTRIDNLAQFLIENISYLEAVSTLKADLLIPEEVREYLIKRHGSEIKECLRRLDRARNSHDKFVVKQIVRRKKGREIPDTG